MRANEFITEAKLVDYEGITLKVTKNDYELMVDALDDWGNNVLGHVTFYIGDDKELDPQDLWVNEKYQRQGIAKTMYDYVKKLGYKIVRSWDQTDAGSNFWDKHRGDVRVWEGKKTITEYRDRMYQYLKSIVPDWPDYIVKDWLYANFAKGETYNKEKGWSFATVGKDIPMILKDMGLSVDTKWQLVPNMKFTMDMWEPKTLKRLQARAGGNAKSADPAVHIPARDAERHATQAALAKQQGGVRKEPVILMKTANGYELLEGWHRTIQHFHMYPQGYTGPAYVAVQGN